MNFSEALELLKQGKKISRGFPNEFYSCGYYHMNGDQLYFYLKFLPNKYHPEGSSFDEPYNNDNYLNEDDVLADDWEVVDE